MKTIKGIGIKSRNFDKFKKVADLIYFDGALLSQTTATTISSIGLTKMIRTIAGCSSESITT